MSPRSPSDTSMPPRFDIDPERRRSKDSQDVMSEKKIVYVDNSQSEPVEEELTLSVPPPVKGFDISAKFTCKSKNGEIIMDDETAKGKVIINEPCRKCSNAACA